MVVLPLLLIWLRDPMYFNAPSRWAVVLLAIATGLLDPQTLSDPPHGPGIAIGAEASTAPASGQPSNAPENREANNKRAIPLQARIREGTRLAPTIGQFSQLDAGWMFQYEGIAVELATVQSSEASGAPPAAGAIVVRLKVLENLTLQRIVQVMQQDPNDNHWLVSGIITEYFGENRLMISAAVRATTTSESTSQDI
jgi:hypothetical protein